MIFKIISLIICKKYRYLIIIFLLIWYCGFWNFKVIKLLLSLSSISVKYFVSLIEIPIKSEQLKTQIYKQNWAKDQRA